MSVMKIRFGLFTFVVCLIVGLSQLCSAQSSKMPATWWPDPATGLMWTGQSSLSFRGAMNWDDAGTYCSSLTLGGFSGWRLPTIPEMRSEEYLYPVTDTDKNGISQTVDFLGFKGNVQTVQETRIWTSSVAGNQQYFSVFMGPPDVFGILFKAQFKAALNPDRSEAHVKAGVKVGQSGGVKVGQWFGLRLWGMSGAKGLWSGAEEALRPRVAAGGVLSRSRVYGGFA